MTLGEALSVPRTNSASGAATSVIARIFLSGRPGAGARYVGFESYLGITPRGVERVGV